MDLDAMFIFGVAAGELRKETNLGRHSELFRGELNPCLNENQATAIKPCDASMIC